MKFGSVPVEEAEGAILAHSLRLTAERISKGTVLDRTHLAALQAAGISHVTVARLEAGDIGEDAAAETVARALVPDPAAAGLRPGNAATGRVNLHATGSGLLLYDPARIHALNGVDPMVTLAVLAPCTAVQARMLVATVKIISYGVDRTAVARASEVGQGALRIAPPVLRDAALIETEVAGTRTTDKGARAMTRRLDALGMSLDDVRRVPHEVGALAAAIAAARSDLILMLTASATSDTGDVAPEAIRQAGGTVTRFGMPVDPGNLLVLGEVGGRPVIGLPGCARSPAPNGADFVLERIACGLDVTDADIAAMGVGGLLKESPARGRRREP